MCFRFLDGLDQGLAVSNLIGRVHQARVVPIESAPGAFPLNGAAIPSFSMTRPEPISNDVIKLMNEAEQETLDAWKKQLVAGHPHYAMAVPNRIRIALSHYFDAVSLLRRSHPNRVLNDRQACIAVIVQRIVSAGD